MNCTTFVTNNTNSFFEGVKKNKHWKEAGNCVGCLDCFSKLRSFEFLLMCYQFLKKMSPRYSYSVLNKIFKLSFLQIMHIICCFPFRFSIHDSSQEKELLLGHVSMILDMVRTCFFDLILLFCLKITVKTS